VTFRARLAWIWSRYRTPILVALLAVGLLLGIDASVGRLHSIRPDEMPTRTSIGVAFGFLLVGQVSVGYGWRRLVPTLRNPIDSMWTFHATQPGKYLPLGAGQAVGQVSLASGLGMPTRGAAGAWASHLSMIVAAGVTVGSLMLVEPGAGPIHWLAPAGLLGLLFVYRPTLQRLIGLGARVSKRLPTADDLPGQRELVEAFLLCVLFIVLDGIAFGVLLGVGTAGPATWVGVVGAYGLAVGLSTATPLPAGLGVRELLLVRFVAESARATITSSIVLRVMIFVVEVALLVTFSGARQVRNRTR
jgi:hypothetical protein